MTAPSRYVIPGDVLLVLAVRLGQAFDGLKLAALAANEGDNAALATSLTFTCRMLDDINETLLAITAEHAGEREHGSDRPC